jgi:hypothetical protein
MTLSTLGRVLRRAKGQGLPVEVTLVTGHSLTLTIRGVGAGWFSGQNTGGFQAEVVVAWEGLQTLQGALETGHDESPPPGVPLQVMLAQLGRHKTEVLLHTSSTTVRCRITEVGQDYLQCRRSDQSSMLIPLTSFLWLEACG